MPTNDNSMEPTEESLKSAFLEAKLLTNKLYQNVEELTKELSLLKARREEEHEQSREKFEAANRKKDEHIGDLLEQISELEREKSSNRSELGEARETIIGNRAEISEFERKLVNDSQNAKQLAEKLRRVQEELEHVEKDKNNVKEELASKDRALREKTAALEDNHKRAANEVHWLSNKIAAVEAELMRQVGLEKQNIQHAVDHTWVPLNNQIRRLESELSEGRAAVSHMQEELRKVQVDLKQAHGEMSVQKTALDKQSLDIEKLMEEIELEKNRNGGNNSKILELEAGLSNSLENATRLLENITQLEQGIVQKDKEQSVLNHTLHQLTREKNALQTELQIMGEGKVRLESKVAELEQNIHEIRFEAGQEIKKMSEQLEIQKKDARRDISELMEKNAQQQQNLSIKLRQAQEQLGIQGGEAEEKERRVLEEKARVQLELKQKESQLEEAAGSLSEQENKINSLLSQVGRQEGELRAALQHAENEGRKHRKIKEDLSTVQNRLQHIEQELDAVKERARRDVAGLQSEVHGLTRELERTRENAKQQVGEIRSAADRAIQHAGNRREETALRLHLVEGELRGAREAVGHLNGLLDNRGGNIQNLMAERDEARHQRDQLGLALEAVREELEEAEADQLPPPRYDDVVSAPERSMRRIERARIAGLAAAAAPVVQPPVVQPPVAQPPVAQAPVAQAPVAQAPVAQPLVAPPPVAPPLVAPPLVAPPPVAQAPVAQARGLGPRAAAAEARKARFRKP